MDHEAHTKCIRQAAQSLQGLSCGDAFGERFFVPDALARSLIWQRAVPAPPWFFTDDTVMALSIVETLAEHRHVHQDALAKSFAARYDPGRGYGPAMHKLLATFRRNHQAWRTEPFALFDGQGSYGNGSAMRVAPLGAYFACSRAFRPHGFNIESRSRTGSRACEAHTPDFTTFSKLNNSVAHQMGRLETR
jgi:ADP-ribosylglycohydrolase